MKIDTLEKLQITAAVNQKVFDVLNDTTVGRKKAAEVITRLAGTHVSEKLVRTYRERNQQPVMPRPSGPAVPQYAIHIEDPDVYAAAYAASDAMAGNHEDRLSRYTPNTHVGPVTANDVMKDVPRKRNVAKTSRTIVIMPDVQAPLHDEKLVDKFVQFLADYEPDELAQVGDFTDSTEISRWVRGKKGEFAGDLQFGLNSGKRILEKIRDVTDVRFRIVRSNHDDRLELYIAGCAPGLEGLDALTIENLAGFNEFDVEFIRDEVVELTPEARDPWIMCHGDEGSLNSIAGRTAFNLAKNKFGANVVCGHTHRAGLTSESYGYNGQIRDTRHGMEVGHFMDLTKADYLKKKGVAANWQQSFGILHVHGSKVYPQLVTVDYDGNFSVEGKLY
ncbi:phosphoesterase [Streptomyces phage LuckySocke]|jgi:predicted phosphodiesterase|nr:phosphoesterase [Streptomyces phage Alone3]WPH59005.1 phosphoesterase [Streptomyces phage LuckySocke]